MSTRQKVFILCFFLILVVSCGEKIVELGDPNFDGNSNTNDEETDDSLFTDNDSPITTDDDSPITTDDDSPLTDNDSPVTDNDSPLPDDDSPLTDDDVITCTENDYRCNTEKTWVQKCVGGNWTNDADCTAPLKMCVEDAGTFSCEDLTCVPETTYCKTGDVYTCDSDGMGDAVTEDCTNTQYCDDSSTPNFPAICADQVCTPDADYCDSDILKTCDDIGSGGTTKKDCTTDGGTCDAGLLDCVYVGELGADDVSSKYNTGRGNIIEMKVDATLVEFSHKLNFTGNMNLSWYIYESSDNSSYYNKIFSKSLVVNGEGDKFYSSGSISIELKNGKKYAFYFSWSDRADMYAGVVDYPFDLGFADGYRGFGSLSNPDNEQVVPSINGAAYTQRYYVIY